MATVLREMKRRSSDLRECEMGLQVGKHTQLGMGEGRRAQRGRRCCEHPGTQFLRLFYESSERWSALQNVVDLSQEMLGRGRLAEGEVHRRELQPEPHRDDRRHIGGRRPPAHRLAELPSRLGHVTARNCEPRGCGVDQEGRRVVLEPRGLDDAARDTQVLTGALRVAAVKCQQSELGLRDDEGVAGAHPGTCGRRLGEQVAGLIDVAAHEVGFAEQPQDHGPPRTPWRLLGLCHCRIGQRRLGAVLAHQRSQQRPGGLERCGTIPRWQVERGGVDHRRPTLRPHGVARVHGHKAGVHRQRRPGRDRLVAQSGEPALERRQSTGVVERLRQLGRQPRRPVPIRGSQQVLDCHRWRPVGLVPVRRP